mmetsp:Transcript_13526/g.36508  ORF Transcript_13526/g.36508 Transcript_13526/m.36508 type:complete len:926 (+) Transcript_13526:84-2861(+)
MFSGSTERVYQDLVFWVSFESGARCAPCIEYSDAAPLKALWPLAHSILEHAVWPATTWTMDNDHIRPDVLKALTSRADSAGVKVPLFTVAACGPLLAVGIGTNKEKRTRAAKLSLALAAMQRSVDRPADLCAKAPEEFWTLVSVARCTRPKVHKRPRGSVGRVLETIVGSSSATSVGEVSLGRTEQGEVPICGGDKEVRDRRTFLEAGQLPELLRKAVRAVVADSQVEAPVRRAAIEQGVSNKGTKSFGNDPTLSSRSCHVPSSGRSDATGETQQQPSDLAPTVSRDMVVQRPRDVGQCSSSAGDGTSRSAPHETPKRALGENVGFDDFLSDRSCGRSRRRSRAWTHAHSPARPRSRRSHRQTRSRIRSRSPRKSGRGIVSVSRPVHTVSSPPADPPQPLELVPNQAPSHGPACADWTPSKSSTAPRPFELVQRSPKGLGPAREDRTSSLGLVSAPGRGLGEPTSSNSCAASPLELFLGPASGPGNAKGSSISSGSSGDARRQGLKGITRASRGLATACSGVQKVQRGDAGEPAAVSPSARIRTASRERPEAQLADAGQGHEAQIDTANSDNVPLRTQPAQGGLTSSMKVDDATQDREVESRRCVDPMAQTLKWCPTAFQVVSAVGIDDMLPFADGSDGGPFLALGDILCNDWHVLMQAHVCNSTFRRAPLNLPEIWAFPHLTLAKLEWGWSSRRANSTIWTAKTPGAPEFDISAVLRQMNEELRQDTTMFQLHHAHLESNWHGHRYDITGGEARRVARRVQSRLRELCGEVLDCMEFWAQEPAHPHITFEHPEDEVHDEASAAEDEGEVESDGETRTAVVAEAGVSAAEPHEFDEATVGHCERCASPPSSSFSESSSLRVVLDRLVERRLGRLKPIFEKERLSVSVLPALTDERLETIGISRFGDRHKVLQLAAELGREQGQRP